MQKAPTKRREPLNFNVYIYIRRYVTAVSNAVRSAAGLEPAALRTPCYFFFALAFSAALAASLLALFFLTTTLGTATPASLMDLGPLTW